MGIVSGVTPTEPSTLLLNHVRMVLPDGEVRTGNVVVERGIITALTEHPSAAPLIQQDNVHVIEAEGAWLTPGLVDLQLNGAYGMDFSANNTPHTLMGLLEKLPAHGLSHVAATLITQPELNTLNAINTVEETLFLQKKPTIGSANPPAPLTQLAGIHLEGPFLSPEKAGTHATSVLDKRQREGFSPAAITPLLSPNLKLMTIAPELDPSGETIAWLTNTQGITVWAGHCAPTERDLMRAIDNGLSGVTHWMNAMAPLHHRTPGIGGLALVDDRLTVSVIADGHHIHPAMLAALMRCKPRHQVVLVSDAMALSGLPEGTTLPFAGTQVTLTQGKALNTAGQLAGSVQLLDQVIRNVVRWQVASFPQAIRMATETPARVLGIAEQAGHIRVGAPAHLVLWDPKTLDITHTWLGGQLAYHAQQPSKTHQRLSHAFNAYPTASAS